MVSALRNAGIRAELYLGNPKNNLGTQLKYADKRKAPCAVIQGPDEKAKGEVQLRDLIAGSALSDIKDRVADVSDFLDAARRVGSGGTALDPEVVAQLLARSRRRDPLALLTPRERDVLGLMAEGRSNTAIARALVVSDGAVEKHVSNIFTKLDLPPTDHDHRRVLAVLRWLEA